MQFTWFCILLSFTLNTCPCIPSSNLTKLHKFYIGIYDAVMIVFHSVSSVNIWLNRGKHDHNCDKLGCCCEKHKFNQKYITAECNVFANQLFMSSCCNLNWTNVQFGKVRKLFTLLLVKAFLEMAFSYTIWSFKLLWKDTFICGIFQSAAIKQSSSQYFEAPVSPLCLKCEAGIKNTISTLPTEIAAFSYMYQSCCCLHRVCPDTYDIGRAFLTSCNNSPPQDQYQQNQ